VFRRLALLTVTTLALACAGRRGVDAKQTQAQHPIDIAPQMIGGAVDLPPILCGPEDDDLPAACEAMASHPQQFQFVDDVCRIKRFPLDDDHEFSCPSTATSADMTLESGKVVHYKTAADPVVFDDDLRDAIPDSIKVSVILVRRVDGVPHYRYVSNGTSEHIIQTWSSSKFMAIANAASTLRAKSNGAIGLDGTAEGVPLGDLVSIVHSYDERFYSSNALSKWFHDVGGRAKINDLLHGWLGRPSNETLGGNYGPGFVGIPLNFRNSEGVTLKLDRDAGYSYENHVSTHTMAEFLKRLVMHREDEATRLPHLQWSDVRTIFYGADSTKWFEGRPGGMSADRSVYMQLHDFDAIVKRSQGHYRILSKSGMGSAQYVHAGYACFPSLDSAGHAIPDQGREAIISVRVDSPAGYVENDRIMARTYKTITRLMMDGKI
jgi:hypothetical protein